MSPREPLRDETSDSVLSGYLTDVSDRLPGSRRWHTDLLRELRDGLQDAVEYHRRLGTPAAAAAALAIRESGPPDVVAAAYTELLHDRQAKRTALALLASGPVVGITWLVTLAPGQTPDVMLLRYPILAPILVIGVAAAALTLVLTGRLRRWLPATAGRPVDTATAACLATMICDASILATASASILGGTVVQPVALTFAVAASSTRFALSQHAARQHLASACA